MMWRFSMTLTFFGIVKHSSYTAYTLATSKVNIKLHLQLIALYNRIFLLLQLLHVPCDVDISATQPISLHRSKPDNGVCR